MWRTLFTIPHALGPLPVLGVGWLLAAVLVGYCIYLARGWKSPEERAAALRQWPSIALLSVAIGWILPSIELRNADHQPLGLAVRGYGLLLMLSIIASIVLAAWRAKRRGYPVDDLYILAIWLVLGGLVGARIFYVVEYWPQLRQPTWRETIANVLNFTRGGMVVYGSLIGGLLAGLAAAWHYRFPILKTGDLIIPSVFLGVALGRIGCLLNGCCYGDRCEPSRWAAEFPPGSPPYVAQLESGELVGLHLSGPDAERRRVIDAVDPGSLAAGAGLQPGMQVLHYGPLAGPPDPRLPEEDLRSLGIVLLADGRELRWTADQLPPRSLPLVPAQLIGAVTALGLVILLLLADRWGLRQGALLGLGFAGYAVIRFGLEMVRNDEPGQFGTQFTIAQWVSVVTLLCCAVYLVALYRGWIGASGRVASV